MNPKFHRNGEVNPKFHRNRKVNPKFHRNGLLSRCRFGIAIGSILVGGLLLGACVRQDIIRNINPEITKSSLKIDKQMSYEKVREDVRNAVKKGNIYIHDNIVSLSIRAIPAEDFDFVGEHEIIRLMDIEMTKQMVQNAVDKIERGKFIMSLDGKGRDIAKMSWKTMRPIDNNSIDFQQMIPPPRFDHKKRETYSPPKFVEYTDTTGREITMYSLIVIKLSTKELGISLW